MESQLDSNLKLNHKREQIVSLTIIALGYCLFVLSAFNYQSKDWFPILLALRVVCVTLPVLIIGLLVLNKIKSKNADTTFFTFALFAQSILATLEGPNSQEFYFFAGVIFVICSLSYRGLFSQYLKTFFPLQFVLLFFPVLSKNPDTFHTLGNFVDIYSSQVVGVIIGVLITRANSRKFEILLENMSLKEKLHIQEKQTLEAKLDRAKLIEDELIAAKKKIQKESQYYAVGLIASQISHDIRSPLSALNLAINTIDSMPDKTRELMTSAIERINLIAKSILVTKNSPPSKSFGKLLDSFLAEQKLRLSALKNIQLETKISSFDFEADAEHANEVFRLITNLVNNSIEAIDEHGQVQLHVFEDSSKIIIHVRDNGRGIPQEVLGKLGSEPISYGKNGVDSGFGIGLKYVYQRVEDFKGHIQIQSVPDLGTKIRIEIPITSLLISQIICSDTSNIVQLQT